jgi:hypothetical protein
MAPEVGSAPLFCQEAGCHMPRNAYHIVMLGRNSAIEISSTELNGTPQVRLTPSIAGHTALLSFPLKTETVLELIAALADAAGVTAGQVSDALSKMDTFEKSANNYALNPH